MEKEKVVGFLYHLSTTTYHSVLIINTFIESNSFLTSEKPILILVNTQGLR